MKAFFIFDSAGNTVGNNIGYNSSYDAVKSLLRTFNGVYKLHKHEKYHIQNVIVPYESLEFYEWSKTTEWFVLKEKYIIEEKEFTINIAS